jgi:hypothetical protein
VKVNVLRSARFFACILQHVNNVLSEYLLVPTPTHLHAHLTLPAFFAQLSFAMDQLTKYTTFAFIGMGLLPCPSVVSMFVKAHLDIFAEVIIMGTIGHVGSSGDADRVQNCCHSCMPILP